MILDARVRASPAALALAALAAALVAGAPEAAAQAGAEASASTPSSAPAAASAAEPTYVGSAQCTRCHRGEEARFANTPKGAQILRFPRTPAEAKGCEGCHGPGSQHVEVEGKEPVPGFLTFARDDPAPVEERNAVCLQCHEGSARIDWAGSTHEQRGVACTNCHRVMEAASERGHLARASVPETCAACHAREVRRQQLSFSHMPVVEGRMGCTSCHNPHGSANERLLVAASVNEVCYACHAEKRGPFLWEHAPVAESCANCHDPHGSRNEKMLTRAKPRLCQQCHVMRTHPATPQLATSTRMVGNRQCVNCHSAIHGSNHPAGSRFTR